MSGEYSGFGGLSSKSPFSSRQSLFFMTAFLVRALSHVMPVWWPVAYGPTVAVIIAYALLARCVCAALSSPLSNPLRDLEGAVVSSVMACRCGGPSPMAPPSPSSSPMRFWRGACVRRYRLPFPPIA
jgi:hypothetical protein